MTGRATRMAAASVLLFVAVMLALAAPPSAAAQAEWTIDRFDVGLTVEPDGTLQVVETIDVDFTGISRRGIFRTIPVRYAVALDDPALPEGAGPDAVWRQIEVDRVQVASTAPDDLERTGPGLTGTTAVLRIGDEDVTITGPQRYELRYRVRGALNDVDGAAELVWNATGDDWEAPITEATVRVGGAPVASVGCVQGPPGAGAPCAEVDADGASATYRATDLPPGSGATITAVFAPGSVAVPVPDVRERWTLTRALVGSAAAVPLAALGLLLGLAGVVALTWRQGRDRVTRGGTRIDGSTDPATGAAMEVARRRLFAPRDTPVRFRPPDGLRPAQLGVLVDEQVDPVEVSATVVDLAVRGHLQIEETTTGRFRKKTDWILRRAIPEEPDMRLPYEQLLLDELFAGGDEQQLSALEGSWAGSYAKVAEALYDDAVARGWFPRSPAKTRARWAGIGIAGLVVAVALTVALIRWTTVGLLAGPLLLTPVALLLASGAMPHRTAKGSQRLDEALGFREFIRTAEADRMDFAEREQLFLAYLPYAVVFGATDRWARTFAALGTTAVTAGGAGAAWYVTTGGRTPSFSQLSDGLSDFSSRTATSLTTAPASSGGGGGSSGGGFGGGGGGSW